MEKAAEQAAEEIEREILEDLLSATTSGDYGALAEKLAQKFWGAVRESGGAVVTPFRDLFAALVEKCPELKGPLEDALADGNPARNILPS